jgi:hypothetical protein
LDHETREKGEKRERDNNAKGAKVRKGGQKTMRDVALFLNGAYDNVLQDILKIQEHLPDQILYLQPYSGARIKDLAEEPPSVEDPVRLLASITSNLPTVHYVGQIVGWDDKRELGEAKLEALRRVIGPLQPTEDGVYGKTESGDWDCVNLLYVRRLRKLDKPFSVAELTNARSGGPLSTNRSQPGGWVYVVNPDDEWLEGHF